MEVFWNLLVGALLALAIPLHVPVRDEASPMLVILGLTGALLAVLVGHALGASGGAQLALTAMGTAGVPAAVGLIGKRSA